MVNVALQVPRCRQCLWPLSDARTDDPLVLQDSCSAVLEELCHQVEETQEGMSRLCSIREYERETDLL